jgi:thiamine transport system ATP-binding protein
VLTVQGIRCSFDNLEVLHGINLAVDQGEIMCLLGPSGCGKTTLLRVIAGLETTEHGDVLVNSESVMDIPVHQRDFGLMFQEFALFPHMNVEQNIAFGLKMRGMSKAERLRRAKDVLELVGLAGFEGRDVAQLSGGERQRVALARSIAPNPHLLMLDEPMGALDASLRERLVIDLRNIIKRVGLTAVYVTHDQIEAFAIADRIAIMNAGVVEQIGTPESVYKQPKTVFVAQFLGLNNIVPILERHGNRVETAIGTFDVPSEPCALLLHPDGIRLASADVPGTIPGEIRERVFLGDAYRLRIAMDHDLTVTVVTPARDSDSYMPGTRVNVQAENIVPLC